VAPVVAPVVLHGFLFTKRVEAIPCNVCLVSEHADFDSRYLLTVIIYFVIV